MTRLSRNAPLSGFGRIYVVNLPERRDPRRATERELAALGHDVGSVRWFDGVRSGSDHGFPSAGAYGCFQSHLGVLREAAADGLADLLVLEDDVRTLPALTQTWPVVRRELDARPWDIAMFGFARATPRESPVPGGLVRVQEHVRHSHCYAVVGRVLPRLISFLEQLQTRERGHPDGGRMHYDGAINVFCDRAPDVVRVRTEQRLVVQRSSRSDIASLAWYDRSSALHFAVEQARALRERRRGHLG